MRAAALWLVASGCLFITAADREQRAELLAGDTGDDGVVGDDDDVVGDDDDVVGDDDDDDGTIETLDGAYVAVSMGYEVACAVDDRGDVSCWSGDDVSRWWPEVPPAAGSPDFVGVSMGLTLGCAWSATGETRCFGQPAGSTNNPAPSVVEVPGSFDYVACGHLDCCGVDGGELVCWDDATSLLPNLGFEQTTGIASVALWGDACTVSDAGEVDCFSFGSTGGGDPSAPWDTGIEWLGFSEGGWACAMDAEGSVGCWNVGASASAVTPLDVPSASELLQLQALDNGGVPYVCGLEGGTVACYGPVGQSAPPPSGAPAGNWSKLSMRNRIGCVIDAQGAMTCWGDAAHRPSSP